MPRTGVSEMLDKVPEQLHVVRLPRPQQVMQAAAPERLIAGGLCEQEE
jgi:hypothetical protein